MACASCSVICVAAPWASAAGAAAAPRQRASVSVRIPRNMSNPPVRDGSSLARVAVRKRKARVSISRTIYPAGTLVGDYEKASRQRLCKNQQAEKYRERKRAREKRRDRRRADFNGACDLA